MSSEADIAMREGAASPLAEREVSSPPSSLPPKVAIRDLATALKV